MHKALKILSAALILLLFSACAEGFPVPEFLPEGGIVESSMDVAGMRFYSVSIPETGEEIIFTCDAQGALLSIRTETEAPHDPSEAPVDRARVEELVQAAYPGSRVLFVRRLDKHVESGVAADAFCGVLTIAGDQICSRSIEMGEIYRDGLLTMEGALKVLRLHRPEAEFRALELDEDDGEYVYEGEALVGGVEYEFELSVRSGKLLEWERD